MNVINKSYIWDWYLEHVAFYETMNPIVAVITRFAPGIESLQLKGYT